jgi:hypothetical protein
MLIQPNSNVAAGKLVPDYGTSPKPSHPDNKKSEDNSGAGLVEREESLQRFGFPSAPISDSREAEEALKFIRRQILSFPAESTSAQANSRPETVFELLQGL